jgi:8-oxo-dGTP diphosphatase
MGIGEERTIGNLLRQAEADGVRQFRVGALIVRDGAVLLLRRAPHDSFPGIFELPSGGVEPGEEILEGLSREVDEETGLRVVTIVAFAGSFDYRNQAGEMARQFNFAVEVDAGEARLDPREHDQLIWVEAGQSLAGVSDSVRVIVERFWDR